MKTILKLIGIALVVFMSISIMGQINLFIRHGGSSDFIFQMLILDTVLIILGIYLIRKYK